MVQVRIATLDHTPQVIRAVQVPLLVIEHQVIVDVGHRESVADALKNILGFCRQVDGRQLLRCRGDFNRWQWSGGSRGWPTCLAW